MKLALLPLVTISFFAADLRAAPRHAAKQASLDDAGQLRWRRAPIATLSLPPPPRKIRVRQITVSKTSLIHVIARGAEGRATEALFIEPVAKKPVSFVFKGATGTQGVDGEWSLHLDVSTRGVLRYQRRDGVRRCDGQRVMLFAELYDFKAKRFRAARPRAKTPKAVEIVAKRAAPDMPSGPPLNTFRLDVASTQAGDQRTAKNLTAPVEADDGRPATAWAEAVGGDGRGEFLTARAQPSPYRLKALSIVPGDAKSKAAFAGSNRLKSALLLLSPTERYRVLFQRDPLTDGGDVSQPYWVVLPKPSKSTCATLLLETVYAAKGAGRGGGRTAIAELRFYTDLDFGKGLSQVVADLGASDESRQRAAVTVLRRIGEAGVRAVIKALPQARGVAFEHSIRILTTRPWAAAITPLVNALPKMRPPLQKHTLASLARSGDAAVAALAPLLSRPEDKIFAAVAHTIGRIGGAVASEKLLTIVGKGDPSARQGVIDGLVALRSEGALKSVLERLRSAKSPPPAAIADLLVVASHLAAKKTSAKLVAEALLRWIDKSQPFEVRYRALRAIGRLDVDGHVDQLVAITKSERDVILRLTAVEQLRRSVNARATSALRDALADGDPRIRAIAAIALLRRKGKALDVAIATALDRERWAIAGRALAEALGRHCSDRGAKALRRIIVSARSGIEERALLSLVQCRPKGLAKELLAIAANVKMRAAMRKRALAALPTDLARLQADRLVSLFHRLRRNALRSSVDEEVAAVCAGALSRLRTPNSTRALIDALALDASGPVRAAAARALSRYCPAGAGPTVARAITDNTSLVRQAAKLAVKICKY